MCGIFGNTAEDSFRSDELNRYLDSTEVDEVELDEEECFNCGEVFEQDLDIFHLNKELYCLACYESIKEDM